VSTLFSFELSLISQDARLDLKSLIGQPARLDIELATAAYALSIGIPPSSTCWTATVAWRSTVRH
jgi:uncharacterized protein involved in type VI secretion and phage assembly